MNNRTRVVDLSGCEYICRLSSLFGLLFLHLWGREVGQLEMSAAFHVKVQHQLNGKHSYTIITYWQMEQIGENWQKTKQGKQRK